MHLCSNPMSSITYMYITCILCVVLIPGYAYNHVCVTAYSVVLLLNICTSFNTYYVQLDAHNRDACCIGFIIGESVIRFARQ